MGKETNLYDEYLKDGGAYKQDICGECGEDSKYIKWLENKIKNLGERSEPPHPLLSAVPIRSRNIKPWMARIKQGNEYELTRTI